MGDGGFKQAVYTEAVEAVNEAAAEGVVPKDYRSAQNRWSKLSTKYSILADFLQNRLGSGWSYNYDTERVVGTESMWTAFRVVRTFLIMLQ